MPNYAHITLIGHIGRDAERKVTPSGQPVLEWTLAVNTDRKAKDAAPTWYRCSLWGSRADAVQTYLTKGKAVMVEGPFTVRTYTDRDGAPRVSLDVRVSDVVLLGPRDAGPAAAPPSEPARGDEIPF